MPMVAVTSGIRKCYACFVLQKHHDHRAVLLFLASVPPRIVFIETPLMRKCDSVHLPRGSEEGCAVSFSILCHILAQMWPANVNNQTNSWIAFTGSSYRVQSSFLDICCLSDWARGVECIAV